MGHLDRMSPENRVRDKSGTTRSRATGGRATGARSVIEGGGAAAAAGTAAARSTAEDTKASRRRRTTGAAATARTTTGAGARCVSLSMLRDHPHTGLQPLPEAAAREPRAALGPREGLQRARRRVGPARAAAGRGRRLRRLRAKEEAQEEQGRARGASVASVVASNFVRALDGPCTVWFLTQAEALARLQGAHGPQ